jgi:hypothetical protein
MQKVGLITLRTNAIVLTANLVIGKLILSLDFEEYAAQ